MNFQIHQINKTMVHHITPTYKYSAVVQAVKAIPTAKRTKPFKRVASQAKPIIFGDIVYYEVGVNSWNQPEEEYMYNT
ncbi:ABC transporter C family member [Acrasis kona]|uniref:ABC transporter C family member n=1 Tax=Acrasis kona TaxID=1008807 RepID=A0AAW2YVY7_9EUKA